MNTMDQSEKVAESYLRYRGHDNIQFEPDGNRTPDFLVDNNIAVEVRRLNQNHDFGRGRRGLEEDVMRQMDSVRRLLSLLGPPLNGQCWFVWYRFSRLSLNWKAALRELKSKLESFKSEADPQPFTRARLGTGFEVTLVRTESVHSTFFVLGGPLDREAGGWVHNKRENLEYCTAEKMKKVAGVRDRYALWWLILVDHIGFGLDDFDACFRKRFSMTHNFDKVILVDPGDHTRAFEICPDVA